MSKLVAENFTSDSRVVRAKEMILEALSDHQKSLKGVRPAKSDLQVSYGHVVEEFGQMRGGPLFYPYLGSGIGNGALVELADGSVKYDFISGIGVHHWGHSRPELVEAGLDAAVSDTVMQGNLQQNREGASLAKTLLSAANSNGAGLGHCFFSTSGAMANENALKILMQKKSPARRILAFQHCFMGRTLALSSLTDKPDYRQGLPSVMSVDYVPFFDPDRPEESTAIAVKRLKEFLARYPGEYAAMSFELVQGESGFYPGDGDFFTALMQVLKDNDVPVMVDEIQTFGRTSELFAFQSYNLDELVDVITIGKVSQVCATLFTDEFRPGPGLISQTFTSSTAAFHAAAVIVNGLLEQGFFGPDGKIARLHKYFVEKLCRIDERNPGLISGPFGTGAMIAFTPFGGNLKKVKEFLHNLFEAGVIAFYAGSDPYRVRFLVPVGAVTFEQIDEVADIVERTLVEIGPD
jgi:4-aminobutyrate aminotransferase-like enzyme